MRLTHWPFVNRTDEKRADRFPSMTSQQEEMSDVDILEVRKSKLLAGNNKEEKLLQFLLLRQQAAYGSRQGPNEERP